MRSLALDVGNTKTAVGLFGEDGLVRSWRVTTRHWTPDELGLAVLAMLDLEGGGRPELVSFATVVPQVRHAVRGMSSLYLGRDPVEVTFESSGIRTSYPEPGELGADRLANAAAAIGMGLVPAIVADFGTATTFDVIDGTGCYLGGAIAPGIGTAASELFRKAERLNPVDLQAPGSALGTSTGDAVRSGVLIGAAGAADRIVEALSPFAGPDPVLLATGGWAPGIAGLCRSAFRIVPFLTLEGIDRVGRSTPGREA